MVDDEQTRIPPDFSQSAALYSGAQRVIPGGVTSSVRAGAQPHPLYFERGSGPYLWDVDGNRFLDFVQAFGPSILGHAPDLLRDALCEQARRGLTFGSQHRAEVRVAELLTACVPGAEQALLSTTGSEAVAVALRIARAATGRTRVIKFEGHYHGWLDGVFASGGFDPARSGAPDRPATVPATAGIAPGALSDLIIAPWNDAPALDRLLREHAGEVAAVVLEPVNVNGGVILPEAGYLQQVRDLTRAHGCVLIFDEVITGFRLALGGAQAYYGVQADLVVFAKALAGGLAMSAITGSRDLLRVITDGKLLHNGTFNGNALASAAAVATLTFLIDNADTLYSRLHRLGARLAAGLEGAAPNLTLRAVGPIVMTAFGEPAVVRTVRDRSGADATAAGRFLEALLRRHIHARQIWYISAAHTEEHVDQAVAAARAVLSEPLLANA
jgi:glutamate-1-semialdehyde 2,1-aminomutase